MKTRWTLLCKWSIPLIVACGGPSPALAEDTGLEKHRYGGYVDPLAKYRGDWGCSSQSDTSFFGPIAGLWLMRVDRSGNTTGEQTVASADPFIELSAAFNGKFSLQANGSTRGAMTARVTHPPGLNLPESTFTLLCIGLDTQGDRYREMRCLDVTDEPAGTDVGGLVMCKPR